MVLVLATATPALSAPREGGESVSRDFRSDEERFGALCRPPLKFAAGACLRECPAGYRDTGRGTCSFQRMSD